MDSIYIFNYKQYKIRREYFGGLLLCKKSLSIFRLAPLAADVLSLFNSPKTQETISRELGILSKDQSQVINENLRFFLKKW